MSVECLVATAIGGQASHLEERNTVLGRDAFIDFLRGLTIINMVLVHFRGVLPELGDKIIDFTDLAMESFVFLAGFMIRKHYLEIFEQDKNKAIRKLYMRALKILALQYIMIATISIPFYAYFRLNGYQELLKFSVCSALLLNQIPILHILPTFIPLLLAAPIILFCLAKKLDNWLLGTSILVFLVGSAQPDHAILGNEVIFPVVLWQIYFVMGCYLGKFYNRLNGGNVTRFLIYALLAYMFCVFLKFGGYIHWMHNVKMNWNIYPKKFPLNVYGVFYGTSFLFLFYSVSLVLWRKVRNYSFFGHVIPVFGRNSLLTFIIHVYFAYLVSVLQIWAVNSIVLSGVVISNFYITYRLASYVELTRENRHLPRAYSWLFSG